MTSLTILDEPPESRPRQIIVDAIPAQVILPVGSALFV